MIKYLIIILLLLILYIYCYYIFPDELSILQTNMNEFTFELLFKKQPIVIEDKNIDINYLLNNWFNYNIINNIENNNRWNHNNNKYLIIHSINDVNVLLCDPKNNFMNDIPDIKDLIIEIKLKKGQILIIPFKWYYNIDNNNDNYHLYGIHDYITNILEFI